MRFLRALLRILVIAAIGLLLGAATSWAQLLLPGPLGFLANSASGWTIPTVIVVALLARSLPQAAVGGAAGFVALVIGYDVMSTLRGFPADPIPWAPIGVVAGPVVGVAARLLRECGPRAAVAAGLLAGIGLGDAGYGWTVVGDTTDPVGWGLLAAIAVGLLVAVVVRIRRSRLVVLEVGVAVVVAAAFVEAYLLLGGLLSG